VQRVRVDSPGGRQASNYAAGRAAILCAVELVSLVPTFEGRLERSHPDFVTAVPFV